jgi:hypothetical protein
VLYSISILTASVSASCSTTAKRDWEGILRFWGLYAASEEVELDIDGFGDGKVAMLGGGDEFGWDRAGDRGEDGVEFERSSDVSDGREEAVPDTVWAVFPLLRVGSKEVTEGIQWDSLSNFTVTICGCMRQTMAVRWALRAHGYRRAIYVRVRLKLDAAGRDRRTALGKRAGTASWTFSKKWKPVGFLHPIGNTGFFRKN